MEAPGTKVMAIDHYFQTSMENCACNWTKSCTRENNAYRWITTSVGGTSVIERNETEGGKIRWFLNENYLPRWRSIEFFDVIT